MDKPELLEKILSTSLPSGVKEDIIKNLSDRYLVETVKTDIRIGDSKMGGFPHLPKEFDYPQEDSFFYEFIAQINLSELEDNEIPCFPKQGMLYFFIEDDFHVRNVNTKILFNDTPNFDLEVKKPPDNKRSRFDTLYEKNEHMQLRLSFEKGFTINQHLLKRINNEFVRKNADMAGFDIETFYARDQIWGFPAIWGISDSEWLAYLANRRFDSLYYLTLDHQLEDLKKQNIDFRTWINNEVDDAIRKVKAMLSKNDMSPYISKLWEKELVDMEFTKQNLNHFVGELENHKVKSKNWRHLLSISSKSDANIDFGDGKMEFLINMDDLKNGDFSNVHCDIYN